MKKMFLAVLTGLLGCSLLVGCAVPNSASNSSDSIVSDSMSASSDAVTSSPDAGTSSSETPATSDTETSSSDGKDDTATEEEGYAVTFQCDEHVSVVVYADQEMQTEGVKTNTALSLDKTTGQPTLSGEGQVNFLLVFDEGYSLNDIVIDGTFNNLKGFAETGIENGYRITKIGSSLTVTVSSKETAAAEDLTQGYEVTFNTDEHVRVEVYRTQSLTDGEETNTAYSRNSTTGALTKDGTGQVNFLLVFDDGYSLGNIAVDGTHSNLKGSADTGMENAYRITKIGSSLTVTVTSKQTTEETETTPTEPEEEDLTNAYKVTFEVDEHTHVTVYRTQTLTAGGEDTTVAYARNGDTGVLLSDGSGQVNFVVTCDEGYAVSNIAITGKYNQMKTITVTAGSAYRITKIGGELTVTITSSPVSA